MINWKHPTIVAAFIGLLAAWMNHGPNVGTTLTATGEGTAIAGNGNAIAQGGRVAIVGNGNNVTLPSEQDELKQNEGILIPGNEPSPKNSCNNVEAHPNSLTVLLGGYASLADKFPHTILNMAEEPLLVIDRNDKDGSLIIKTLRIFDEQDNRVAQVISEGKTNKLFVSPQSFIRFERPDHHTLTVYDRRDKKILDLRFLNKETLSVQGIFRNHGKETIINADSILINPDNISIKGGGCFAYNGVDFSIR